MYGITPEDYLQQVGFQRIVGHLVMGRIHTFDEIASTGRSGSFFLRSLDGKLLVKSLPPEEHMFLRKHIRAYYDVSPPTLPN